MLFQVFIARVHEGATSSSSFLQHVFMRAGVWMEWHSHGIPYLTPLAVTNLYFIDPGGFDLA